MNNDIAVISDIHGNSWALKAVLKDIKNRNIDTIVNLGDCVYGPLDPAGTMRMIMESGMLSVSGNEDEILFDSPNRSKETVNFVKDKLNMEQLDWLRKLPDKICLNDEILLFHGSPVCKREFLLNDICLDELQCRSDREIKLSLQDIDQSIILCGHTHLPDLRRYSSGRIIMNPGSVGLQAYTDDNPVRYFVQNGSPYARYSILKKRDERWIIKKVELYYDWKTASRTALRNGRLDWADWLTTGKVSRLSLGNVS